jgi:thioester reductase-like protein
MATKRVDGPRETLLFTGFPGFIGARLLPRLLELRPAASIRCLVQAKFEAMARASLGAIEEAHAHTRGRIEMVVGDITEERLGLGASDARDLQRALTGAYHLAAVYDLAVRRHVAERINVQGTRNVLAFLSGATGLQRLDYVSTAYVSGTATGVFRETDLDVGQSFKNHYEATKFRAEVDVVGSGLPFAVYRPGIVVGDSRTGETAKFDGPYFALTAMERMPAPGVFIKIGSGRSTVNLIPVDFIVEALARLSSSPKATGRTYHLTDPNPVSTLEIERLFAKALGKSFAFVPVPAAAAKMMFTPGPVQRLFGMPVQAIDYFDHACRYDSSVATAELAALGVTCPRFPDYVDRLVAFYLRQRGSVRREAMV